MEERELRALLLLGRCYSTLFTSRHYQCPLTSAVLSGGPGLLHPPSCSRDGGRSLVSIVSHQSNSTAVTGKGCLYRAVSLQGHPSLEPSARDTDFIHCPFSLIVPTTFLLSPMSTHRHL